MTCRRRERPTDGGTMKISAKDSVYLLEIRLNIPEKAEKRKGN